MGLEPTTSTLRVRRVPTVSRCSAMSH